MRRKVYSTDRSGNVTEYETAAEAARTLNGNESNIIHALKTGGRGYDLLWSHAPEPRDTRDFWRSWGRKVIRTAEDGTEVIYESVLHAATDTEQGEQTIYKAIYRGTTTRDGSRYRYA